jgi:hypothetical protein
MIGSTGTSSRLSSLSTPLDHAGARIGLPCLHFEVLGGHPWNLYLNRQFFGILLDVYSRCHATAKEWMLLMMVRTKHAGGFWKEGIFVVATIELLKQPLQRIAHLDVCLLWNEGGNGAESPWRDKHNTVSGTGGNKQHDDVVMLSFRRTAVRFFDRDPIDGDLFFRKGAFV